ncbi:TPA: NADH-quinone oxidoreductase subunit D [Candidatus Bathyarchaeota archaeon]|nr:NADH-quinone oxidoreductase subunit D [Candidatus Bathyarchaeota archaeon]
MSEGKFIELLIGPQHPTSGHTRFIARLDGDIITEFEPDIGWVHRTIEKIAETKTYIQIIPLIERQAILDAANHNLGYVLALEKLLGIEAPPKAHYLRTLVCELNRIASHLYGIGIHGIMIGSSTAYMWAFGDRELFVELIQMIAGARLTYSYVIPGGVRRDLPDGFKEKAKKAIRFMRRKLKDYFDIFLYNPVTLNRLEGIGAIKRDDAIKLGLVGPNLRASGVKYDVRKAEPYAAYPELDFEVAVRKEGDSLARVLVRIDEIQYSMDIIEQVLDKMPNGPLLAKPYLMRLVGVKKEMLSKGVVRLPTQFVALKPKKGEAIARVECGRGETLYHVISNGLIKPYRFRLITPSFRNVIAFSHALIGHRLADVPAVYGSLDYFPPEADR